MEPTGQDDSGPLTLEERIAALEAAVAALQSAKLLKE